MKVQRPIPFLPLAGLLAALLAGCGADNAAGSTEPTAGARIAPAEVSSSASAEAGGDDGFRAELNGELYRASLHNACLVTREGRERVPSLRMTFNQGKDAVQIVVPLVDGAAGARPIAMAIVNRGKDSYVGLRGGQAELDRLEQTARGYVVTGRFDIALRGVGSGAGMEVTGAAFADLECVDLGKTLGTHLGE